MRGGGEPQHWRAGGGFFRAVKVRRRGGGTTRFAREPLKRRPDAARATCRNANDDEITATATTAADDDNDDDNRCRRRSFLNDIVARARAQTQYYGKLCSVYDQRRFFFSLDSIRCINTYRVVRRRAAMQVLRARSFAATEIRDNVKVVSFVNFFFFSNYNIFYGTLL